MTCKLKFNAAFHTLLYIYFHISPCTVNLKLLSIRDMDVFRELQERYFGSNNSGKFEAARIRFLEVLNSLNGTNIISAYDIQATGFEDRLKKVSCLIDDLKG